VRSEALNISIDCESSAESRGTDISKQFRTELLSTRSKDGRYGV
jgi:hypothetical protein